MEKEQSGSQGRLPAHPPRAVGRHTGPPNIIEGEFREVPAANAVIAVPQKEATKELENVERAPARKIGEGHVAAMLRAGLKELSQILPAFPDGIKPVEEPGLVGVPTNMEVSEARSPRPRSHGIHGPASDPLAKARERANEKVAEMSQDKAKCRSY